MSGAVGHGDTTTASGKNAAELSRSGSAVGHVVQHVGGQDDIKPPCREWQGNSVGGDHAVRRCRLQHPDRQIAPDRLGPQRPRGSEISAVATAHVQHRNPGMTPTRSNVQATTSKPGSCRSQSRWRARRFRSVAYWVAGFVVIGSFSPVHPRPGRSRPGRQLQAVVSPMKRMTGYPGSSSSQRTSQSEPAVLRTIAHKPLLNRRRFALVSTSSASTQSRHSSIISATRGSVACKPPSFSAGMGSSSSWRTRDQEARCRRRRGTRCSGWALA